MAARSTRARRPRRPVAKASAPAATKARAAADSSSAPKTNGTPPSHLTHHRMIAQSLNALLESFGDLRKQVIDNERTLKRADKELDTRLYQLLNQVEAFDKKLVDFVEEMTTVAFEANLKLRANTDQIAALWDALRAVADDSDEVNRRQKDSEAHEEARQAEVDRRLHALVTQQQETARTRKRSRPRKKVSAKK